MKGHNTLLLLAAITLCEAVLAELQDSVQTLPQAMYWLFRSAMTDKVLSHWAIDFISFLWLMSQQAIDFRVRVRFYMIIGLILHVFPWLKSQWAAKPQKIDITDSQWSLVLFIAHWRADEPQNILPWKMWPTLCSIYPHVPPSSTDPTKQ